MVVASNGRVCRARIRMDRGLGTASRQSPVLEVPWDASPTSPAESPYTRSVRTVAREGRLARGVPIPLSALISIRKSTCFRLGAQDQRAQGLEMLLEGRVPPRPQRVQLASGQPAAADGKEAVPPAGNHVFPFLLQFIISSGERFDSQFSHSARGMRNTCGIGC
jgi:hypothetical protein